MKKIVILLMILAAPMAAYSKFNAGISVGYNASEISADWDKINSGLKSGFQVGVFARFGDKLFLQPELLYASRNGSAGFQDELWDGSVKTGMFQIPVMLGYRLTDGDLLSFNLQAGPVMSILTDKGITGVDEVYKKNSFEDFTWGVQLGAGMDFMSFMLNVRYEFALSDIYSGSYNDKNFSARANTFLVTLGWKIL
jgi:hypothetical protein